MKNSMQQNPSNAGDDDNLWPDWNSSAGTGKDSRGYPDGFPETFGEVYENTLGDERDRAKDRKTASDDRGEAKYPANADPYNDGAPFSNSP